MDFSEYIVKLYAAVFDKEKNQFGVEEWDVRKANRQIGEAYKPNRDWELEDSSQSTDYNDAAHRCAYLHKYAMLHTALTCDALQQALQIYTVKQAINSTSFLNLCSLGSGPGTDIVALIFVLADKFGVKRCRATLVDCSVHWRSVFEAVVTELRSENFEYSIYEMVSQNNFSYRYMGVDLLHLNDSDQEAYEEIRSADIITMIKFISAVACKNTRSMINRIFHIMKPGAILLFVDNDAGGFFEMLSETAKECGLESIFGPLRHWMYEEPLFDHQYGNIRSQFAANVTAGVWKKPETSPQNTTRQLQHEFWNKIRRSNYEEDYPALNGRDTMQYAEAQCAEFIDEVDHPRSFPLELENISGSGRDSSCCTIM